MSHIKVCIRKYLKNIVTYALLIATLLNLAITAMPMVKADAYSSLGTNLALGSPVLNKNALSDNWNKYEAIVWGIFLGNFCTPFIDNYESAFNLSSSQGSQGHGLKSLSFGAGSDVANNSVLKDLVTYSINNQETAVKQIKVSYNILENNQWACTNAFDTTTTGSNNTNDNTDQDNSEDVPGGDAQDNTTPPPSEQNPSGTGTQYTPSSPRTATLADLFLPPVKEDAQEDGKSWTDFTYSGDRWGITYLAMFKNYTPIAGVQTASLPTFAIDKGTGAGYEIVLDYRENYDIQMFTGALASALNSSYRDKVVDLLNNTDLNAIPLYIDSYGNICGAMGGRYVVIIPSSANQYITKERSINLLNSLVFNCGTPSNSTNNLILNAGQAALEEGIIDDFYGKHFDKSRRMFGGGPAFNNNSSRTKNGGMAIYYDTDSIVIDNAKKAGYFTDGKLSTLNSTNNKLFNANNLAWAVNAAGSLTYGIGIYSYLRSNWDSSNNIFAENHSGKTLKALFDLDIADPTNTLNFKIEPVYSGKSVIKGLEESSAVNGNIAETVAYTLATSGTLVNQLETNGNKKRLTYLVEYTTGNKVNIFEDSVIIPVQCDEGVNNKGEKTEWAVYRNIPNYIYKAYKGDFSSNSSTVASYAYATPQKTTEILDKSETTLQLMDNFALDSSKKKWSQYARGFVMYNKDNLYKIGSESDLGNVELGSIGAALGTAGSADLMALRDTTKSSTTSAVTNTKIISPLFKYEGTGLFKNIEAVSNDNFADLTFNRNVKLYYSSEILQLVSNVLGIRDGTDFSVYASNIYLTYLDWYQVKTNKLTGEQSVNLNFNIINEETSIEDITNVASSVKSKEDMEADVLRYSYLMLNPDEGKAYRSEILLSNMGNWLYDQYQKIVYGGADTYYYSTVATKNNTGFLSVDNYSQNFMTSWFMNKYPTYGLILIGLGIVCLIIVGVLKRRKISWFILGITAVISVVIVLPSTGEIVPYVANNTVQKLFDNKMTYWSISEQCTNASIESNELIKVGNSKWTPEEKQTIQGLLKSVQSLYLDRYLSIKQDISNKVTSTDNADYDEIQNMRSTRWLLPMIMRQYTANDNSADYVYVTLGDKLEDCSNMYWYYSPKDAEYVSTLNAQAETNGITPSEYPSDGLRLASNRSNKFGEFKDLTSSATGGTSAIPEYRCKAYSSVGRQEDLPHTYFYMLDMKSDDGSSVGDINILSTGIVNSISPEDPNYKSYSKWASAYSDYLSGSSGTAGGGGNVSDLRAAAEDIMGSAGSYNRYDRSTIKQNFGYLWATESPLPYFYMTVKDSFSPDATLGTLVGELQGQYIADPTTGIEHRETFMHDSKGYTRDSLDLENLFNNMIPYIYSVQLMAEGYENDSGVFGDETIKTYDVYKGNKVSWLFRSNWVTKIMENNQYNEPATIKYKDSVTGETKSLKVENMLIPSLYHKVTGEGRDMVFSKSQQIEAGLDDGDLSLVELKCIEINEDIARKWTLLLNYVGTKGITREVMQRQMAIDATMAFCKEFSPTGITNQSKQLQPYTLDLRSISFDSVMKMLMLNVTRNTSFIYGDTMETLITTADIVTAFLLLAVATLCVFMVPLARNVALGLMFYLGFIAVGKTLFKDANEKAKTSIGYLGCHVLYLLINIVYLLAFKMLMTMTSTDEVLTIGSDSISVGNPTWCLILVGAISSLFLFASFKMIKFCIINYRDMGFAALKGGIELVGSNISSGFEKLLSKMEASAEISDAEHSSSNATKSLPNPSNRGSGRSGSSGGSGGSGSSGRGSKRKSGGNSDGESIDTSTYSSEHSSSDSSTSDDYYYNTASDSYRDNDPSDVNATIERGKKIEEDEKKADEKKADEKKDDKRENKEKKSSKSSSSQYKMDTPMSGENK